MVFCCIAIVGIAVLYFVLLWLRQLLSGPRRDLKRSNLPAPPRVLSGHGALPVYGHTYLFTKYAGDVALFFPSDWKELGCWPWSRTLGDCFAVFIWGQWRVAVKGPERAKQVMESMDLKEAFPWTPPKTLLGKSCLPFLGEQDADQLRTLLGRPLSHRTVLQYAPIFSELAEKCLDDALAGKFTRSRHGEKPPKSGQSSQRDDDDESLFYGTDHDEDMSDCSSGFPFKIKWEALRSYTFDLIDGPILSMNKWIQPSEQTQGESTKQEEEAETQSRGAGKKLPERDTMLLWMERMKRGVDVIKLTFGPEWMYIWLLNEYGRALNARTHLQDIISKHVEEMTDLVPSVEHKPGHAVHDPSTRPIPLLTLRENLIRGNETIFGYPQSQYDAPTRARSKSAPDININILSESDEEYLNECTDEYVTPFKTEQDLARPRYEKSPAISQRKAMVPPPASPASPTRIKFYDEMEQLRNERSPLPPTMQGKSTGDHPQSSPETPMRLRFLEEMEQIPDETSPPVATQSDGAAVPPPPPSPPVATTSSPFPASLKSSHSSPLPKTLQPRVNFLDEMEPPTAPRSSRKMQKKKELISVLERLLRQQGNDGEGISRAVMSELTIILWMMLDVGNAWTAMALNLLASDKAACNLVQQELDALELEYGRDDLFTPSVLKKMKYLDALLYEAVRLCPAFLGGLKTTTETIEFEDIGVQLPKNSHIFFCQPTDMNFDIHSAVGRKPELLGQRYPSLELHGFLPLEGLEVPLMVLQSKVFLIVLLQKYTPFLSKKKTFIRRVKTAVSHQLDHVSHQLLDNVSRQLDKSIKGLKTKPKTDESHPASPLPSHDSSVEDHSDENNRCRKGSSCDRQSSHRSTSSDLDLEDGLPRSGEMTQTQAMRLFTKLPFPEPKRVIYLQPRGIH